MKIVVVEDEARARAALVRLIRRERPAFLVVGEADNGVDGMRLIKQLQPGIVISDIRMPRMDGLKMIKNVFESSLKPAVIILSAYSDFEYAKLAIHYGVYEYLLKPVTADELTEVLDRLASSFAQERSPDLEDSGASHSPIIRTTIEWIQTHYDQRITLEELAERQHVTASYLSTLFSKETGTTFSAYLRDHRIQRAKELLRGGDCLIYEVAYQTGFEDVQYFCRVFKSMTGCSAKQYLRSHIGKDAQPPPST